MDDEDYELIFQLRYNHGLSQTKIARKFEVTPAYINNILHARKKPGITVPLYLKYKDTDMPLLVKELDRLRAAIAQRDHKIRELEKREMRRVGMA